jgi:hypothetical protein
MRLSSLFGALCVLLCWAPAAASASFGFEGVDLTFVASDGSPATHAGSHPFAVTATVSLHTVEDSGKELPDDNLRDLRLDLPAGLVADAAATPSCTSVDFEDIEGDENSCPDSSAVGIVDFAASSSEPLVAGSADFPDRAPVYKLAPAAGAIMRLGMVLAGEPVVFAAGLHDVPPYNGYLATTDIPQTLLFYRARIVLWGVPANPAHDESRGQCALAPGSCPVNVPEQPLLTLPRNCTGPLSTTFMARSWQAQGQWAQATVLSHDGAIPPSPQGMTGCGALAFAPVFGAELTTDLAETPAGLTADLDFTDEGLANPSGLAQSEAKRLDLSLPEALAVEPAFADHPACTPTQYAEESLVVEFGKGCPAPTLIGTIDIESPLLPGTTLEGDVFAAEPDDPTTSAPGAENPFDSEFAAYVVVRDASLGILVKQAASVERDPLSGETTMSFDDLPQLPVSHLSLQIDAGGEGPFVALECGEFSIASALAPWATPGTLFMLGSPFEIIAGPEGGPCSSEEGEENQEPGGEEPEGGGQAASAAPASSLSPILTSPAGPGPREYRRPCRRVKHRVRKSKAHCKHNRRRCRVRCRRR